jgi:hypothetical protein
VQNTLHFCCRCLVAQKNTENKVSCFSTASSSPPSKTNAYAEGGGSKEGDEEKDEKWREKQERPSCKEQHEQNNV